MCTASESPEAGVRRRFRHETLNAMNHAESAAHKELKRLALIWAQVNGYRVAAAEVLLPNYRFGLDVAGYRPERVRISAPDRELKMKRLAWLQTLGVTAVFSAGRQSRIVAATLARIQQLSNNSKPCESRRPESNTSCGYSIRRFAMVTRCFRNSRR